MVKVTRKHHEKGCQPRSKGGYAKIELSKAVSPWQFNQPQGENIMANKAQAFITLNTFADSRVALIQGMKDAGYKTIEACRPIVIEWACSKTGAEYRETKGGKVVLVSDH